MKTLSLLCLFLTTTFASADKEALKRLDALFDLRIKANEEYRDEYAEEAMELENKEVREYLAKSEKKLGQDWVDFVKRMKANPDLGARIQFLRLELQGELNSCYYDLEYSDGVREQYKIRGDMVKWKKQLKELEEVETLLKKKTPEKK